MNEYIGKICPYCKTPFKEGDEIVLCSACDMPHHKDCWVENQGCTVFGCMGTIKAVSDHRSGAAASGNDFDIDIAPGRRIYCPKCGAENSDENNFCEKCGQTLAAQKAGSPQHTHYAHSGAGAAAPLAAAQLTQTYQQTAYQPQTYQQTYQQQAYQQPAYQQQAYQQTAYQQPSYQQQTYQQNAYQQQAYQQAAYQQNAYQQQAYQQAAYQQTAYQQTYQQAYQQAAPAYQPDPAAESAFIGEKSSYYSPKFAEMRVTNRTTDWNWCSFLFGTYWFAYRKMYVIAAIYCGITLVAGLLNIFGSVITIAAWFCSGIFGNYLYMKHVEQRLQEANSMPEPMRTQHIGKHSGTSVGAVFLFLLPSLLLSLLLVSAGLTLFFL